MSLIHWIFFGFWPGANAGEAPTEEIPSISLSTPIYSGAALSTPTYTGASLETPVDL